MKTKNFIFHIVLIIFFFGFLYFIQLQALYPAYTNKLQEKITESENSIIKYEILNEKKVKTIFIEGKEDKPLIIYFHGNYELIDNYVYTFETINKDTQINILLIEYNGYGNSEGVPSLKSTNKNIIEWLSKNKKEFNKYIVWGRSIGSIHAYDFALNNPTYADKLIIQSGFLSPINAITNNDTLSNILKNIMFFDYEAKEKIKKIVENKNIKNALIIHGKQDELFNIKYAKQTYNIFKETNIKTEKEFFEGNHNTFKINKEKLYKFFEFKYQEF